MYKYGLVLVLVAMTLGARAQLEENVVKDSMDFFTMADPKRANFKLGGQFYRTGKWHKFKRGLYPIEVRARYRVSVFDTIDMNADVKMVAIQYELPYTPEAQYLNRKMLRAAVPFEAAVLVSARQYTWMAFERRDLKALALEVETSPLARQLETQFAERRTT